MKFLKIKRLVLTVFFGAGIIQFANAQCSFTGLNPNYCAGSDPVTLVGSPAGGVFSGSGISGDQFNPVSAGAGTHSISYSINVQKKNYYIRAAVGEPWSSLSNTTAMNTAFGAGEWTLETFEAAVPASVFSEETAFVFMDGSDFGSEEFAAFLSANLTMIEDWVEAGGRLLLNAAPNEGGDILLGFDGTTLLYEGDALSVDIALGSHPAYLGPNVPTAYTLTGTSFSNAHINGADLTPLLAKTGDASYVVLSQKAWGNGMVMFGAMTATDFHSPSAQAANYRANLLVYLANYNTRYYVRSSAIEPFGTTANPAAMNAAFGTGQWTMEFFESMDVSAVFSTNTKFVFIDGSAGGELAFNSFLIANLPAIESWVQSGGSLFMNAAPYDGGDINFGFGGSTLVYDSPASSVDVLNLSHPAYLGPKTPTAPVMTGSSYSHAHITGTGFTKLLRSTYEPAITVLCEKEWGGGNVMMGGMTTTNFHYPSPAGTNWRVNLFVYMESIYDGYLCSSTEETTVLNPISISAVTEDVIFGSDGSIDITVTGGMPAYSFDWDTDGTGDFDDTEDLSGLNEGTYAITVQDANGCLKTVSVDISSQAGVGEQERFMMKVYPNPSYAETIVNLEGKFNYSLYDVNGKLILAGVAFNQVVLDLTTYENGVYLLQISSELLNQTIEVIKQ